jgi:hypothetical protein
MQDLEKAEHGRKREMWTLVGSKSRLYYLWEVQAKRLNRGWVTMTNKRLNREWMNIHDVRIVGLFLFCQKFSHRHDRSKFGSVAWGNWKIEVLEIGELDSTAC